jgi:hypothetical protein
VLETFRRAASGAPPGEKLSAMGRAYTDELLPDRHAVLMMMQGFAAAGADPDIRAHVRQTFRDMAMEVAALGGVAAGVVWAFFANGMLLNIVAALELQDMACRGQRFRQFRSIQRTWQLFPCRAEPAFL